MDLEIPLVPPSRFLLVAILFLSLGIPLSAQDATTRASVGLPVDWSFRHLLQSRPRTASTKAGARRDPRLLYNRMAREQRRSFAGANRHKTKFADHIDWNFTLGAGKVAPNMSPAKFTFSPTATPSCTSDYVVFALDTAGSSSQPNLVQFNNLYSAPTGTNFCSGSGPSVMSAYDVTTVATGAVLTSPALSLDGTQVAFIETVTGTGATCPGLGANGPCSIFHVLTFGTTGSNGSFDAGTNTYTSAVPGTNNNAVMTSLTYSSSITTISSPWIDYHNDVAYFGDDNGMLYKTTCAFLCSSPPAIDAGWPIPVAAAGVKLTGAVLDPTSNRIFVGGSDGSLYMVDLALCPSGCTVGPRPSTPVGSANPFGAVVDAPMVDITFETIFAFAGDDGTGSGVVLQTNTSLNLAPNQTASMGSGAFFNVADGAFDDAYFTNTVGSSTAVGHLFACGQTGGSGQAALYTIPFTNTGTLSATNPPLMGTASQQNVPGNLGVGCSPLTEFMNGTTDRLFFSQSSVPSKGCVSTSTPVDGCMFMYDITSGSPSGPVATAVENNGTSAIIVDNSSTNAQASSIYFTNESAASCTIGAGTPAYCAIKLTQSALN